jgi:hypothetical protein
VPPPEADGRVVIDGLALEVVDRSPPGLDLRSSITAAD